MKSRGVVWVLIVLCGMALGAQDLDFSFIGGRFNFLLLDGFPLPTGADVEFRYSILDTAIGPTALSFRVGAGYEDKRLVRNDSATATAGDPIEAPTESDSPYRYNSPNAQWDIGLVQALAGKADGNLAEAFFLYRGRYDYYDNDLSTSVFPDAHGIFGTAVLVGLGYDAVEQDSRRLKSGLGGELSFEWGPSFLASSFGSVDYWRGNLQAEWYQPLFSFGAGELNRFSAYFAGFGSVDFAGGEQIPIFVMESFGGRDERTSLGGSVRGYPSKTYDAAFKSVLNLECRFLGPAMFDLPWFMPLVYGFFDSGYYDGLPGASTAAYRDASGLIASVGAGFALDIFDFAYLGFRGGLLLPGDDLLFPVYLPSGKKTFFSIEFLLHF